MSRLPEKYFDLFCWLLHYFRHSLLEEWEFALLPSVLEADSYQ